MSIMESSKLKVPQDPLSGTKVPNVVVGLLIYNNKGEIFLAQLPRWKNMWVVVGGHVEYGETLEECAIREAKEETGLDITDLEFLHIQEAIFSEEYDECKHFIFVNYCARATSNVVKPNDEVVSYQWIDPKRTLDLNLNISTRRFIIAFLEKKKENPHATCSPLKQSTS